MIEKTEKKTDGRSSYHSWELLWIGMLRDPTKGWSGRNTPRGLNGCKGPSERRSPSTSKAGRASPADSRRARGKPASSRRGPSRAADGVIALRSRRDPGAGGAGGDGRAVRPTASAGSDEARAWEGAPLKPNLPPLRLQRSRLAVCSKREPTRTRRR